MFADFANQWFQEKSAEWYTSQRETVRDTLDVHLLPFFGSQPLSLIDKTAILVFRAQTALLPGRGGDADLRLPGQSHHDSVADAATDAADRFGFVSPWRNIKAIKVPTQ